MGKISIYNPKQAPANIQQPYSFTRQLLSFDYNIYELRVLFRILEMIKINQVRGRGAQLDLDNNIVLQFPVSAFIIPGHKNNSDIKAALISLREKTISKDINMEVIVKGVLKSMKAEQFIGIIEKPTFTYNNSFVTLRLNDAWYSYLSDLTRGYTQYASAIAFNCSSVETIKIYQFINHWFKARGRTLKIKSFKKEFNISPHYSISKIVNRFLNPAKKELDVIADRSFNYALYYSNGEKRDPENPVKGRLITKISFDFYSNTKNIDKYQLTDFDHKEASKWLKTLTPRYGLKDIDRSMLYGVIQRYGYSYLYGLERSNRKKLRKLKGKEFLALLSKAIAMEKNKGKVN